MVGPKEKLWLTVVGMHNLYIYFLPCPIGSHYWLEATFNTCVCVLILFILLVNIPGVKNSGYYFILPH